MGHPKNNMKTNLTLLTRVCKIRSMDAQMTYKRADEIDPGDMMFLTLDDDTTILVACVDVWDGYEEDLTGEPVVVWYSEWAPVKSLARYYTKRGQRAPTRVFGPYRPSDSYRVVESWG